MRINISIPEDLHKKVVAYCYLNGFKLSTLITKLLKEEVGASELPLVEIAEVVKESRQEAEQPKPHGSVNKTTGRGRSCLHGREIGREYCSRCGGWAK